MATKTLTITEHAYNKLARLKKENESFSVVIERITDQKVDLMKYFGILSKESGEALECNINLARKERLKEDKKRIEKTRRLFD